VAIHLRERFQKRRGRDEKKKGGLRKVLWDRPGNPCPQGVLCKVTNRGEETRARGEKGEGGGGKKKEVERKVTARGEGY